MNPKTRFGYTLVSITATAALAFICIYTAAGVLAAGMYAGGHSAEGRARIDIWESIFFATFLASVLAASVSFALLRASIVRLERQSSGIARVVWILIILSLICAVGAGALGLFFAAPLAVAVFIMGAVPAALVLLAWSSPWHRMALKAPDTKLLKGV